MEVTFLISAFLESQYPPADRPEIAFAGRSNVGKSTLINVLLGRRKIAKTSSTPGRTRSLNFYDIDQRWYFVDLPGYGYARVSIEERRSWGTMVESYLRRRTNLKLVIVILDIRRDPAQGDLELLKWLRGYGKEAMVVVTKSDKLSRQQSRLRAERISSRLSEIGMKKSLIFSAKTKEGREEIWEGIRSATSRGNAADGPF